MIAKNGQLLPLFFVLGCTAKPVEPEVPAVDTVLPEPAPWVCPGSVQPAELGVVTAEEVTEASGMAPQADGVWVHNDSGDTARLLQLNPTGELVDTIAMGVTAVDFEDAASREGELLVGDIGDNLALRSSVAIHRVQLSDRTVSTTRLTYPDGVARDAEALFVDPDDGLVYLISKAFSGQSEVFRAPVQDDEETWEAAGALDLVPLGGDRLVTAADMHASGRWLAVRTYTRIHIFERAEGEPVETMWTSTPCSIPWERESQGETVAWWDHDLITLSEGAGQTLWRLPLGVF